MTITLTLSRRAARLCLPPLCTAAFWLLAGTGAQAQPIDSAAAQALAASKSCLSCHGVERKIVGPAFRDVAARYRDQKGAAEPLAAKIRKGGAGAWGAIPMPANTQVSEADARRLAEWVLSIR